MTADRKSSPIHAAAPARSRPAWQMASFAAVGVVGYVVDSAITYAGAKYLGLSPELARPPGFIVATIVNFLLNRAITFRDAGAPLLRAFLRYWLVASAGLAVNFAVYSACVIYRAELRGRGDAGDPAALCRRRGRVSTILTFVGFRIFVFRP